MSKIHPIAIGAIYIIITFLACSVFAEPVTKDNVKKAVDNVKIGNYQTISDLINDNPAVLLPLLEPYINDSNAKVRGQVISCAGKIMSKRSLNILVRSIVDKDENNAESAIRIIFDDYSARSIQSIDRTAMRQNLIQYLSDIQSAKAILLLTSCSDKETKKYINNYRTRYSQSKVKLEEWYPKVNLSLCCDIALAELGDDGALLRVCNIIISAHIENLICVLGSVQWINNKKILSALIPLLYDKRDALSLNSAIEVNSRICDIAVEVMAKKANISLSDGGFLSTDKEVNALYKRFKSLWK